MIKQEQADKFLGKHEPKELKEADLASFSAPYLVFAGENIFEEFIIGIGVFIKEQSKEHLHSILPIDHILELLGYRQHAHP